MKRLKIKPRKYVNMKAGMKPVRELGDASSLNKRLIAQFCALAQSGKPMDAICDYLGIQTSSFWRWMRRGEKFIRGNGEPKGHALCGQFVKDLKRATAIYRFRITDKLHTAGTKSWIKFMAILERRDRKNFSRNELPGGGEESLDADEKFV